MGEIFKNEDEAADVIRKYQLEAMNNVINAFNEGYYLGKEHALRVYGGKDEN